MFQRPAGGIAALSDGLLDAVIVLLATWTLVYHLCVVARLGTTWAVALELVSLAAAAVLSVRLERMPAEPAAGAAPTPLPTRAWPVLGGVTVVAALVAAVGTATSAPWVLVWVPWLVSAAAGVAWALGRSSTPRHHASSDEPGRDPGTSLLVLGWAVAMAGVSLFVVRPNPDDLFYLNYSQWVTAHGTFPVRDSLFSDLVYPMANWPPVASYDGLVGTAARLAGVHAASVEYVVVPPVASALAVLALWRLLRTWRVRQVAVALSVALAFLLLDGTVSYATPGNLFVTRLWQGKVILLCVVVPLLLVHALRYVEQPTRRRLVPLGLSGIASVGLTTTAIFLTPLVAVAGVAPLFLRDRRRALEGLAALAGYPLGAGIVTVLLGGRSADDFGGRRLYRFDASWIGHQVFLTGVLALVGVLAVLLGSRLVPHPAARVTTGLLALFTGLVLVPGATHASYAVSGLGPTLWRVSWGLTVAALVGLAVVRAGAWLTERVRSTTVRQWTVPATGAAAVVVLAIAGAPIWSADTSAELRAPFHWQRSYSTRSVVSRILQVTRPGDKVLAPDALSITLAVTTTEVKAVAPRDYYMHYLRDEPGFHFRARLALVHYVNHDNPRDTPGLARDLRVVGVQVVCTAAQDRHRYAVLRAAGYTPLLATNYYRCLHRS
jgi:hypothetical protein